MQIGKQRNRKKFNLIMFTIWEKSNYISANQI
jgi:hypothetical protein